MAKSQAFIPRIRVRIPKNAQSGYRGTLHIGDWQVPCVVGAGGLIAQTEKREGDTCTPIGVFPLRYGFFDPVNLPEFAAQCGFPFVAMTEDMIWEENSSSPFYNHLIFAQGEERVQDRLVRNRANKLYDIVVPIGYNDAPGKMHQGSAHFIHAARPDMMATQGCVAVHRDNLEDLARRLQPGMVIDINFEDTEERVVSSATSLSPIASLPPIESVHFAALHPGPRLLVLGAVHGNEICGPKAIYRMINDFRAQRLHLERGSVTFVPVVNYKAYLQNTREGDRNLNRDLREAAIPKDNEDRIANILCPLLRNHDVLLDIHSFKSHGEPFVFAGPANNKGSLEPFSFEKEETALATCLGVDLVMRGWLETFASGYPEHPLHGVGTTEYMRFSGGYAVTLECGNHLAPESPAIAYQAILNTLAQLQLIQTCEPLSQAKRRIKLVKVFLADSDQDILEKPWRTGDTLKTGDVVARRAQGEALTAPENGFIVFPNATAKKGETLFYFAVEESSLPNQK